MLDAINIVLSGVQVWRFFPSNLIPTEVLLSAFAQYVYGRLSSRDQAFLQGTTQGNAFGATMEILLAAKRIWIPSEVAPELGTTFLPAGSVTFFPGDTPHQGTSLGPSFSVAVNFASESWVLRILPRMPSLLRSHIKAFQAAQQLSSIPIPVFSQVASPLYNSLVKMVTVPPPAGETHNSLLADALQAFPPLLICDFLSAIASEMVLLRGRTRSKTSLSQLKFKWKLLKATPQDNKSELQEDVLLNCVRSLRVLHSQPFLNLFGATAIAEMAATVVPSKLVASSPEGTEVPERKASEEESLEEESSEQGLDEGGLYPCVRGCAQCHWTVDLEQSCIAQLSLARTLKLDE